MPDAIIFSDLDGTLLDQADYSFAAAKPALGMLRTRGIPLVLCSSKTRVEIEEIRRVDSGGTLKFLFERGLVRVLGRKEEPGRPMIYGTTAEFLALFGLKSLSDLPSLHEFTELWDEHRELVDEQEMESPSKQEPFES